MEAFLIAHDADLRLYALFAGSLVLLWEASVPAKELIDSVVSRWPRNILLFAMDIFLSRIVLPISTIGLAIHAANQGWGLLNFIDAPFWLEALFALLALDATAYLFHVAMHRNPLLWRVHAVHHSDKDFDCTTGLRFHPIEAVIALTARLAAIAALGIPVIAVVVFEVWAIAAAFYTHANTKIPLWLDRNIRKLFVTSNMHRVHHSADQQDNMTNFGVIFSAWDRLFATYLERSACGTEMPIGLPWFNHRASLGLVHLIALPLNAAPFEKPATEQKT